MERLEKEVAELKWKEAITKESTIEVYKALNDFQEIMEQITSKYFGEGFDLCYKQINRLHLELGIQDIQINLELAEEEKQDQDTGPLSPQATCTPFFVNVMERSMKSKFFFTSPCNFCINFFHDKVLVHVGNITFNEIGEMNLANKT